jgi:hypothetical protein
MHWMFKTAADRGETIVRTWRGGRNGGDSARPGGAGQSYVGVISHDIQTMARTAARLVRATGQCLLFCRTDSVTWPLLRSLADLLLQRHHSGGSASANSYPSVPISASTCSSISPPPMEQYQSR